MDPSARLYSCARCGAQVALCRRCDRGNRYCGPGCSHHARAEAQRQAGRRYQRSWRGRMAHAQRSRRARQRRAAASTAAVDADNVTHQGSQPAMVCAPLAAWTHQHLTVAVAEPATPLATDIATPDAWPQHRAGSRGWACNRCGALQPQALRLGFVRHGRPMPRWRHDHSP
jgi:hypothetical protein